MEMNRPDVLTRTIDETVAENLRRTREDRHYTIPELAAKASEISGVEWSKWRIIDLEGARSVKKPPAAAKWSDLVTLALALKVTIYDLVLPANDVRKVIIAQAKQTEHGEIPDDAHIPERLRGHPTTRTVSYQHRADRDELGRLLFLMPGEYLTEEWLKKAATANSLTLADALADIAEVKEGLDRTAEKITQLVQQQEDEEGS